MPSIRGAHHLALTVTDADRSAEWYCGLLGMEVLFAGDEPTVKFRVLHHAGSGWIMGVRQYTDGAGDQFDEFRTGLDHLAFTVSSRAELGAWAAELERLGVPHTPVADSPIGPVLSFRDPDNIQLEFFLPAG